MPDVIVFDLFGVIAHHQSPAGRQALVATAGVPAPAFWYVYWRLRMPYDRGEVTGAEYWHQVTTELGITFDADLISALIRADIASWNSVNDDVVALIEQTAAAGVRLALLSNAPEELAAYYEHHHTRWLQHFELIAFSCRIGQAKPTPEAFRWCCHKLGTTPDRILFIDDRTENVHAAQRLGIHTHLFIDPATTAQKINTWRRRFAAPAE